MSILHFIMRQIIFYRKSLTEKNFMKKKPMNWTIIKKRSFNPVYLIDGRWLKHGSYSSIKYGIKLPKYHNISARSVLGVLFSNFAPFIIPVFFVPIGILQCTLLLRVHNDALLNYCFIHAVGFFSCHWETIVASAGVPQPKMSIRKCIFHLTTQEQWN